MSRFQKLPELVEDLRHAVMTFRRSATAEDLDAVKNAGSVFLGRSCPEPLGDYLGGTNHTLPTTGTARFGSPLSVDDFIKKIQYTYYPAEAFRKLAPDIARFAYKEGLTGHARSAMIRLEEEEEKT